MALTSTEIGRLVAYTQYDNPSFDDFIADGEIVDEDDVAQARTLWDAAVRELKANPEAAMLPPTEWN